MSDFVPWLRGLAEKGGKGVVNNIDARCLGRVAEEIERLSEIVREDPAALSFDTLLFIGRKMLAEVYPPDIFTGESGDSGPEFIVALRKAIARIDEKRHR